MDKADGRDIAAHIKQLIVDYTEAVIMAERTKAAETIAKGLGEHIFADIDFLAAHAANSINAINEEKLVEELQNELKNL